MTSTKADMAHDISATTAAPTVGAGLAATRINRWVAAAAIAAMAVSMLWNDDHIPSATVLTQCMAVSVWGAFVLALRPAGWSRSGALVQAAIGIVLLCAAASSVFGSLPLSLALCAAGALVAALVMAWAGTTAAGATDGPQTAKAFMFGVVLAGAASAVIGVLQVFAPSWVDGTYLAVSHVPGRAVGNLHQPNLCSSLLVWAIVAAAALAEMGSMPKRIAFAIVALLVLAIELTGSRTGLAEIFVLAAWGWLDKRLSRSVRGLLMSVPLMFVGWLLVAGIAGHVSGSSAVGVGGRSLEDVAGHASPNTRWNIWTTSVELLAQQPWLGVGFGEFNPAWSLTPFHDRPSAHFDHAHNLVLQLVVELGLPLGLLVTFLLGAALWHGWRRSMAAEGARGIAARSMWVFVLTILMHSMVEYPLWYVWFLLPTAFAWGFTLGVGPSAGGPPDRVRPSRAWLLGVLLIVGGVKASLDYIRVTEIYRTVPDLNAAARQLARGQRSLFFAHYADYVAATAIPVMPTQALGIKRSVHCLLDARLMIAWAQALAAGGEVDKARFIAARLHEFRRPEVDEFFKVCAQPDAGAFQCQAPKGSYTWRELVRM